MSVPGRAWSVVERDLKLRSYEDGDPLEDVFVVIDNKRLRYHVEQGLSGIQCPDCHFVFGSVEE